MKELNQLEYHLLGVKIHALTRETATNIFQDWLKQRDRFRYVTSTNFNNIWEAQQSEEFYNVTKIADMSLPDGMPLIWYGRILGFAMPKSCGIWEIMQWIFESSNKGYSFRHFFYGNTTRVLESMKKNLLEKFPNLIITGMYSPPFREITEEELNNHIDIINQSNPDFLWVSLGCPKQELWLYRNRQKLKPMIGGGAGAVFDYFSEDVKSGSIWVKYAGLKWLYRLLQNPKKLSRRYLINYPKCILRWVRNRPADHIFKDFKNKSK